jgi:hypothetical protein
LHLRKLSELTLANYKPPQAICLSKNGSFLACQNQSYPVVFIDIISALQQVENDRRRRQNRGCTAGKNRGWIGYQATRNSPEKPLAGV